MGKSDGLPDFELVFDGGALGNPGAGYGSFQLKDREGYSEISRLDFGDNVTNNQAEYRTLIAGLEAALCRAGELGRQPRTLHVRVRTDSKLVVEQVLGRWKVRHPNLQPLNVRARTLLAQFGSTDIAWHPRVESVRILGH